MLLKLYNIITGWRKKLIFFNRDYLLNITSQVSSITEEDDKVGDFSIGIAKLCQNKDAQQKLSNIKPNSFN